MKVILFVLICVQKVGTNSFQEDQKAVLFGGWSIYLQQLTVGSFVGAQLG